jgi:hypothetical protein
MRVHVTGGGRQRGRPTKGPPPVLASKRARQAAAKASSKLSIVFPFSRFGKGSSPLSTLTGHPRAFERASFERESPEVPEFVHMLPAAVPIAEHPALSAAGQETEPQAAHLRIPQDLDTQDGLPLCASVGGATMPSGFALAQCEPERGTLGGMLRLV